MKESCGTIPPGSNAYFMKHNARETILISKITYKNKVIPRKLGENFMGDLRRSKSAMKSCDTARMELSWIAVTEFFYRQNTILVTQSAVKVLRENALISVKFIILQIDLVWFINILLGGGGV